VYCSRVLEWPINPTPDRKPRRESRIHTKAYFREHAFNGHPTPPQPHYYVMTRVYCIMRRHVRIIPEIFTHLSFKCSLGTIKEI
jgi:hypothetical protein